MFSIKGFVRSTRSINKTIYEFIKIVSYLLRSYTQHNNNQHNNNQHNDTKRKKVLFAILNKK